MISNKIEKRDNKTKQIVLDCIFCSVFVLLPFLHLSFGVEFSDTAYSLGNYEFLDKMNLTWTVATFWANMLGRFFTRLPFGDMWLGMKFYSTLVPVTCVLFSYFYLKKFIPQLFVFMGEVLAISLFWCPTPILYNYLTYLLFTVATMVLIDSLLKENRWGLVIAGVILAFNVFVRFPNVTEVSLILVVWLNARLRKKIFLYGLIDTLICIGGFFAGLVTNIGIIGIKYGFSSIPQMVISLFNMTGENVEYKPTKMIFTIIGGYVKYYKSFIFLVGITIICFAIINLVKNYYVRVATIVLQFILFGFFLFWGYKNHVYTFKYSEYSSMYFWMVVFFVYTNIFSVWALLRKQNKLEQKLFAMALLVIIWITPLGSNNSLYPSINNLFIVAPVVLFMSWNELFRGKNLINFLEIENKYSLVSIRITTMLLFACILLNCLLFGIVFIFRDSGFPYNNHTKIEGNEVLVGMHTNSERAFLIEELSEYIKSNNLSEQKAIFYGNIPGLEYILKMPCAISHTWPNLGSFSYNEFVEEVDKLNEYPVVFVNTNYCKDILNLDDDSSNKDKYLSQYMNKNGYYLKTIKGNIAIYSVK